MRIPNMRKLSIPAVLALLFLVSAPVQSVQAEQFCSDYGVSCYKQVEKSKDSCPFLDFGTPDGMYIGSVNLENGMCWDVPFSCIPCENPVDKAELSKLCNLEFVECDGKCVAE